MKKLWLPLLIVLFALVFFVAGPWYAGQKMEARVDGLVKKLNNNAMFVIEKTAYDKGLFSATTKIKVAVNFAALGPAAKQLGLAKRDASFTLVGKVSHGPLLFDDGFAFAMGNITFQPELSDKAQKGISSLFGSSNPFALNMRFNWDASAEISGSVIGFTSPDGEVKSTAATFGLNLSKNNSHLQTHFNWGGLKAEKKNDEGAIKSVTVGKIVLTSDQDKVVEDLWAGNTTFNVAQVDFADSTKGITGSVENLNLLSSVIADDAKEFLNAVVDVTLKKVMVNAVAYVEDLQYKVSFDHIDVASLQRLTKAIQEVQQGGGTPQAIQLAMGMQLMGIVPEIIKKGFTLRIDALNAKVLGEEIKSNLEIKVAAGTDVTKRLAALSGVTAKLDISLSKALLTKLPMVNPQMLQGLISQGFVVEEAGVLKSHAEFNGSQLTINGKVIPVPGLPAPQAQP